MQTGLQQPDRDMTRFLWFRDSTNLSIDYLDVYRFCRVPFGVKSSSFFLASVLDHHLKLSNDRLLHKLALSLYVDNVVTGTWNCTEALEFYEKAKTNLQEGATMNLREWRSNSQDFMNAIPQVDRVKATQDKVLGIIWDSMTDELAISISIEKPTETPTKRTVCHTFASIFDPMGLFSPLRFSGINLMQELWELDIAWDEPIPQNKAEQPKQD